jgi:phosphoglycerate kinase
VDSTAAPGPLAGVPLLEDLPALAGARVLARVDFNVPLGTGPDGRSAVEDDFRIRAALPTLNWLVERGAEVTACTHLGRPRGKPDPRFDVAPVRARLAELAPGVALAENLRFDPGEEADDPAFVERLVAGFDAYVNDAFGASHRAHASIVGPPARLPSAAGRLLQREVEVLGGLLGTPARPFVAVVGGLKVSDKIGVLRALLGRVDRLVVGGAMAYTFLVAMGRKVGVSPVDEAELGNCAALLQQWGERIVLPVDTRAFSPGGALGHGSEGRGEVAVFAGDIPDGWEGADIGPDTARLFTEVLAGAATVFWNGPMGVFEDPRFSAGTDAVAQALADSPAFTVVGGGDSAAALDRGGLAAKIDFVSTGGGASLELLEKGDLPGLDALRHAPNAPAPRA